MWNAIAGGLNAGQASLLLVFVSRKYDLSTAGIITIAYAYGVFFQGIAKYGMRNFQVTDMRDEYSFCDYRKSRIISVGCAIAGTGTFLLWKYMTGNYDLRKIFLIFEIVILKMIDAYEDVYLGRLQQLDCFSYGARIMALRLVATTLILMALSYVGIQIHLIFLIGITVSGIFDFAALRHVKRQALTVRKGGAANLMLECLPLCIGAALAVYVGNIPKYMIDACLEEEIQAIFGYLMLPVFAVTLLNQFIYQPFVMDLGMKWERGDRRKFYLTIGRQCLIVILITLMVLIGAVRIGIPLLSGLYAINLSGYQKEFLILLAGGSLYAIGYYLNIPLTIMRKQNLIAVGYGIGVAISLLAGNRLVTEKGMIGAAELYVIVNGSLVIFFVFLILASLEEKIKIGSVLKKRKNI